MATSREFDGNLPSVFVTGYDITGTIYHPSGAKMKQQDISNLECPKCTKILREPVQLITCGCRYCTRCIDSLLTKESALRCEVDDTPFTKKHIRKDKGCVKEINLLRVDCPNGCGWSGLLVESEDHANESCPNTKLLCELGCGQTIRRSELETHAEICPKQLVKCSHCFESITKDSIEVHQKNICPNYPMECDYCKIKIDQRSDFQRHLDDICTAYVMYCPSRDMFNCDFKGTRTDMLAHVQEHSIKMFEKLSYVVEKVESLLTDKERLEKELEKKSAELAEKDDLLTKLDDRVRNLEITVRHGARLSHDDHVTPDIVETDKASHSNDRSVVRVKGQPGASRNDRVTTDGISNRQFGNLMESNESNKMQIRQLSLSVQNLQENMTQQSIAVDELRLRQDILDVKTVNGIFTWKIPDIRRRYREAIDRRTVSIYSPPYFTSPQGYRMCTRVYLNGDGIGKGTHISVFFVLMKSECDNLLPWPFKQSVRFTLINQNNASASITEAFAPDLQSPSFQQPTNDMNIASGFPKFAKQSVLQDENFTKGNTIYIKAQVDLTGLPQY